MVVRLLDFVQGQVVAIKRGSQSAKPGAAIITASTVPPEQWVPAFAGTTTE